MENIFNFISGQTGAMTPYYYVNIKPMLMRGTSHPLFQFHLRSKLDHRYYVNTKPMLADPSSPEKPSVARRVVLGTNPTYSSRTLHVRGQRHGILTTNGSEREKSNPLTAGGLLKILRDSHSQPYPMVQGIWDHVLANSSCGG